MKKTTIVTFCVLMMLGIFSVSAKAISTHSVWTDGNGLIIRDAQNGCEYQSFAGFNLATSWTEPAPPLYNAVAHLRGVTKAYSTDRGCFDREFEVRLVKTGSTTDDQIEGAFNVYRDGSLVCSGCDGVAYNLSAAVGNYYKIYVDDPFAGASWLYSGYIDNRKDF